MPSISWLVLPLFGWSSLALAGNEAPPPHGHNGAAPGLATPPENAGPPQIVITVDGMVCSFCVQGVERTMRKIDAVANVALSLESKTISLWLKPDHHVEDEFLADRIKASGFDASNIERITPPTPPPTE